MLDERAGGAARRRAPESRNRGGAAPRRGGSLRRDEARRTYAGVLGKIIGVYFGRPVEGWAYVDLRRVFGEVDYYANDIVDMPLIVPDDDISGTFVFVRALADSWGDGSFSPQSVAATWLNYIVENKTVLWWGGLSRSTEHTAYLRLKRGVTAPESGSTGLNGRAMAEQVGAQIFIDGWGLINPGDPERAAALARCAASVSHDGMAVDAACLVAAMEAFAYVEPDLDKLVETCLGVVAAPRLERLVESVISRCRKSDDWRSVRDWIESRHGYSRYPGNSPIATNHAAVIMALFMAGDCFQRSLAICTSAGWDTDSNAGNVGCLNGVRLGLEGLEAGVDLRSAVADRMFVVSSDGGECVTDAVREARKLRDSVRLLAGLKPAPRRPRFGFEFEGAVQGFMARGTAGKAQALTALRNEGKGLRVEYRALAPGARATISVDTFAGPDATGIRGTSYFEVIGSPSLYPTQLVRTRLEVVQGEPPGACFFVEVYGDDGEVTRVAGDVFRLVGGRNDLAWEAPETGGRPIYRFGIELSSSVRTDGCTVVRYVDWTGAPRDFRLGRAEEMSPSLTPWTTDTVWLRSFVSSASNFAPDYTTTFSLSHHEANGVVTTGSADWSDYSVASRLTFNQQKAAGLVARSRGHRRYYAGLLRDGKAAIVRRRDGLESVLAELPFRLSSGDIHLLELAVEASDLRLCVDGEELLSARDGAYRSGGAGLLVDEGGLLADGFSVRGLGGIG